MTPPTTPMPLARGDQFAHLEDERSARHARKRRFRLPWRRHAGTAALVLLGVLAALAPSPSHASAAPPPPAGYAGVTQYGPPVCGENTYVPINLADPVTHRTSGNYFNFRTGGPHDCIRAQNGANGNLSGYVFKRDWNGQPSRDWDYPFVQSGWFYGNYTCNHRSSEGATSTCMKYPVQLSHDGHPVTSARVWPHESSGNTSWDIWFNHTDTVYADGSSDVELMVWINHVGVPLSNYRHQHLYTTWVGGRQWYVMGWLMGATTSHPHLYTAYIAVKQVNSVSGLWLNEIFRSAAAHGRLSMRDWLTAIDFGGEMNRQPVWVCTKTIPCMWAPSGTGFAWGHYSLSGLPTVGQYLAKTKAQQALAA